MAITRFASEASTMTMPPIVFATAAPSSSGPSRLKIDASTIACFGVAARVATSAAIAFAASWRPFVTANAAASTTAATRPASMAEARTPCAEARATDSAPCARDAVTCCHA